MDQATPGSDVATIVVTSAVLRPGGVWYMRVRLPDWRVVQLVVPADIATFGSVMVAAEVVAALVQSGMVTT